MGRSWQSGCWVRVPLYRRTMKVHFSHPAVRLKILHLMNCSTGLRLLHPAGRSGHWKSVEAAFHLCGVGSVRGTRPSPEHFFVISANVVGVCGGSLSGFGVRWMPTL